MGYGKIEFYAFGDQNLSVHFAVGRNLDSKYLFYMHSSNYMGVFRLGLGSFSQIKIFFFCAKD